MSKKDKEKRKKGEGSSTGVSAWMGDLRPPRSATATRARSSSHPPAASPLTRRSSLVVDDGGGIADRPIPPLRPLPTEDMEGASADDSGTDIAPVGPTEQAGAFSPPSLAPPTQGAPAGSMSMEQLQQQIRDLEARLDEMIGQGGAPSRPAAEPAPSPPMAAPLAAPPPAGAIVEAATDEARATARELLPPDFYLRHWGRASLRKRAEEVDEFGHDPKYEARFLPFLDFLHSTYFRVEAEGIEHIPAEGGCLLVSNHSGGPLPYDGIMLRTTVRREHARIGAARELRWLAEDFVYHLPFVGTAMNRLGAVRACQENAARLLEGGNLVAVFPEGAKGIGKLFRERYQLQRFGRGGFIRLCLRTRTPIVPSAIVGAEEANPMLYRVEYMAKALGIPYLPITPTFPALGPLGLLPAPTKWRVIFGEPIRFDGYGPEAADDDILVGRLAERVRGTIQTMLDRAVKARKSIWFG